MKNGILAATALCLASLAHASEEKGYEANWSSLRRHNMPEWLDGLKFGIYFHWGPQTVQIASGDPGMTTLEAIEQWKGEKFDAKAWVDLIESAGAQFGGPVAWHGSGVLNWDSSVTDWNSVNKGPKVDIFGSLAAELRARNMKVISSYHTSTIWGPIWGPISRSNPTYLDPHEDNSAYGASNHGRIGDDILDGWFDRISEAMDKYQPDMAWFDTGFGGTVGGELKGRFVEGRLVDGADNSVLGIREKYQQKLASYYFNQARKWGKEVEFIYKSFDIPPGIGMRDIEDGNLTGLQYDPWMTDINMTKIQHRPAPWFYNPKNEVKSADLLIDLLVDVTSKNGRVLLNVPPLADGSFAPQIVAELKAMGEWLKINGEAVYNTIPWVFYGEGPTVVTSPGHHGQGKNKGADIARYNERDIRFTQNGNVLYATCLGWPGEAVTIRALGAAGKMYPGDIKGISLLGSDAKIEWEQTAEALIVKFPKERPCDFAYCLKIER